MRITQTSLQRTKAGLHFAQAFFIFIAGCLSLAVLTKTGGTGAAVGYLFGLCFLTIPALIYLVMVPMWTRAWRFANVYAYATLDLVFTILWFAAFVSVATWNAAGISKGSTDSKDDTSKSKSCSTFKYGSASRCEVSKASVGFGVIVCLLFAVTSAMSLRAVIEYRRTGIMPNGNTKIHGQAEQLGADDPNKDAWSTNTDELDGRHTSDPFGDHHNASATTLQPYGQVAHDDDASHGLLNDDYRGHTSTSHDESGLEEGPHPGRPMSSGSTNLSVAPPAYNEDLAPSALSPGGYQRSPGGRVDFPEARYDQL